MHAGLKKLQGPGQERGCHVRQRSSPSKGSYLSFSVSVSNNWPKYHINTKSFCASLTIHFSILLKLFPTLVTSEDTFSSFCPPFKNSLSHSTYLFPTLVTSEDTFSPFYPPLRIHFSRVIEQFHVMS